MIDFLNDLFKYDGLPDNLPDWVMEAPFQLEGAYDKTNYTSQGLVDDIDFVIKSIGNPMFRNKLFSPSTDKRPDFEGVMGVDSGESTHWFLSVSSKLYSSMYDDTSGADLRSTDPRKFYCKMDGEENESCPILRHRWMEEVIEKDDSTVCERCLRIHLCLPDVKHSSKTKQCIWVDDKSVVLYITARNITRVFQPETIELLKSVGYLHGR